ncbi:MAG: Charged multivesicular body protein 7 [Alectoria fallacina]|uniref:Charged multivesicular body protein 7 n=1 Tax=Alectoria fallacina TaxID=1903189 RepID=A0A8H3J2X9_9LECA|nr:MAG: Charged multivesicular body protein 7 [Alectoria fallacina]
MSDLLNLIIGQGEHFRRARLPSLYSDFTLQRYSNPDGFAANTAAWIDALTKAARAGLLPSDGADRDTLSLRTGENLLRSLETKEWGRPLALRTVIDEAVSQRNMIPYQEFVAARKSIHSRNWTVQPWWLFTWGLKQLRLLDSSTGAGPLPLASFVILPNVEEAASMIVSQMGSHRNQIDRTYPMSMFSTEAGRILKSQNGLTKSDLHLILTYLARDKSNIIYDAETVKFKAVGETSSTLSIQDKTIASLKMLIADLSTQVAVLTTRISTLSESAQKAINNKNRTSALAALRSKKVSETALTGRSETLAQLEEVYGKIEQAADQVAILRVMEASTGVLRNLHAQVGGIDRVEDIIEGLRDEMGKVDEIGGAIEAGPQRDSVIDESAVAEELESLEKQTSIRDEEKGARQTQERLAIITKNKESQQERKDDPLELSSDDRAPDPPIKEVIGC